MAAGRDETMALTKIEAYLFGGNQAHFLKAFVCEDHRVIIVLTPMEPNARGDVTATFADATMVSEWTDPEEPAEWPLDILGFDCYQSDDRWKFVLHCMVIEWVWESKWPEASLDGSKQEIR
jgi:hypothetical protein